MALAQPHFFSSIKNEGTRGWRWGRSRQTKLWDGSSFQLWIKRRRVIVVLTASVTRPKNLKGESIYETKHWNGEISIISLNSKCLVPLCEIGTKTLQKVSFWNQSQIKGEGFPLSSSDMWGLHWGSFIWMNPLPSFSLLFSLSTGTKTLKSHTVLSIKTKSKGERRA